MFWADAFAESISQRFQNKISSGKRLIVRDEKTFSGRVHVGSLRGVAIHAIMTDVLNSRGIPSKFLFEVNDFDPMDDCPPVLEKTHKHFLGRSLVHVPSPEKQSKNFAEYYADEFLGVMKTLGFSGEYYRLEQAYREGKFNETIRTAIEKSDTIRRIYKDISGSEKPSEWLPLSIICPQCGNILTTKAVDFDGQTVAFECGDFSKLAEGCGNSGRISPFDGNAKLVWKVDWAAKWKVFDVDIEGAGKDHSTKGGSRDVSSVIAREVFDHSPPFDIPYEFFVIGGKKMSSSKGRGASAKEISDLLPPKITRLLFLRKDPKRPIDFDPEGDTIPNLYDEYDRLASIYFEGDERKQDFARIFELAHFPEVRSQLIPQFLPRFREVAFLIQLPHIDFLAKIAEIKGSALTQAEIAEAELRAKYARLWLDDYAAEEYLFRISDEVPEVARTIDNQGKDVLRGIDSFFQDHPNADGEALHSYLHDLKRDQDVDPKAIFLPIYRAFLGRDSGPKAGWLLSVLGKEFVCKRVTEILDS